MERLTPLAAAFLEAEDADHSGSMAIGSVVVFDGPAPAYEDLLATFQGRLPLVPRYRQVVRRDPLGLGAPYWTDAPDFDLRRHVRRADLSGPVDRVALDRFVSRAMTRRMHRGRPLWEVWFVPQLEDGSWALLSKLHHCLADGISGTDIYRLILDLSPEPSPSVPDDWEPGEQLPPLLETTTAAWDSLRAVVPSWDSVRQVGRPRRVLKGAVRTAQGLLSLSSAARPVVSTSLTGRLDGRRRYAWTEVPMEDLKRIRRHWGVSLNDVALAAISGGFRRLLVSRGEEPDGRAVRSLVPVSTRPRGTESDTGNQVSLLLPYLPVDVADPEARLLVVHERVGRLRSQHQADAGSAVTSAAELGPYGAVGRAVRVGFSVPHRHLTTVTTNVPGPQFPLYALGRRARLMLPYVPIADRVRIGIAMFTYLDTMTFGVTGDEPTTADISVLVEGITTTVQEMLDAIEEE